MTSNIQFTNCQFNNIYYQLPASCNPAGKEIQRLFRNVARQPLDNSSREDRLQRRDEDIFNQVIKTFEERKERNAPFSLKNYLKKLRFNPSLLTYSKWMKQCKTLKYLDLVILIFNHFKSNRFIDKPKENSLFLYSNLIEICSRNNRIDLCQYYFQEMENLGIKADVWCYATLISAYGRVGKLDLSIFYYRKMKCLNIKLSQKCYHALISACGKNHQPNSALFFWREMKKEGLPVNDLDTLSIVVGSLSCNYGSFKQLESALPSLLVNQVKAIQKKGEREGKLDFHNYSLKLGEWIFVRYVENKKDTSPLLIVSGIGKNNKSHKFFSMKSHIINVIKNYTSEEYSLKVKPVKGNLGCIRVLFSKKDPKKVQPNLESSPLLMLVNSLSRLRKTIEAR